MAISEAEEDFVRAWNAAEVAAKRAELVSGRVFLPAVSELRYAGRRHVEALSAKSEAEHIDLIREATRYCLRARHDAIDACIVFLSNQIAVLGKRLPHRSPDENYFALAALTTHLRSKISSSRENLDHRDAVYEEIEADVLRAYDLYSSLQLSPDLAGQGRQFAWLTAFSLQIGAGVVGAIISTIVAFLLGSFHQ